MKKAISVFLSLIMILSTASIPLYAFGEGTSGTLPGGINWSYNSTTHTMNYYGTGSMENLSFDDFSQVFNDDIISVVIGDDITVFSGKALYECSNLETVKLGKSVESIESSIYMSMCESLRNITVNSANEYYSADDYMLYNKDKSIVYVCCKVGIPTVIELPDTVETIEDHAFYSCKTLEEIILPEKLETINSDAFYSCEALRSIELPSGLKSIGSTAFGNCTSLTKMVIPASVSGIESNPFARCSALSSITVDSANPYFYAEAGILFDKSDVAKQRLITYLLNKTDTEYTVPDFVYEIGARSFMNNQYLTKVYIGENTAVIGLYAFSDTNLQEVTAMNPDLTLQGNKKLIGKTFPESATLISYYSNGLGLLADMYDRKFIAICTDKTFVHDFVYVEDTEPYWMCTKCEFETDDISFYSLYSDDGETLEKYSPTSTKTEFEVPESVKIIADGAFENENLKTVTISKNVTLIGKEAFANCPNLETVIIEDNSELKIIDDGAFRTTEIKSITVPESVNTVGESAFEDCSSLESVLFEEADELVKDNPWESDEVALPVSAKLASVSGEMKSIQSKAFHNCPSLQVVDVSSSIDYIADDAFDENDSQLFICTYMSYGNSYAKKHNKRVFAIDKTDYSKTNIYTGKPIEPFVKAYDNYDALLKYPEEYTLDYSGKHIDVGEYKITIEGCGKYEAVRNKIVKYRIVSPAAEKPKTDASKLSVSLKTTSYTYNGKTRKPSVTVKDANGKTVSKSCYTVTYSNNKNVGTATAKVTFSGNYTGSVKKTFTIVPSGTKISKLTAKPKGFSVRWKKQTKQTTGYQIQYSLNKNFKSAKTITVKGAKNTDQAVKKLKSKKKYFVRIRTYKAVKSKKYYSKWSKSKSVKTK